ncbi:MAG: glycosyltransferase family 39 protein [Chloroflexota bacterium]
MLSSRPLFLGVALAALLAPGHPAGLLGAPPLPLLGLTSLIVLVAWALTLRAVPPFTRLLVPLLAALALVRLGLWVAAPAAGLRAEYQAPDSSGQIERPSFTVARVDRSLDLAGDQFPLFFLNDVRRFNFFSAAEPKRDHLPFAARWSGYALLPADARVLLTANGPAQLTIGALSTTVDGTRQTSATLSGFSHPTAAVLPIELSYRRPAEQMPLVRLEYQVGTGERIALGQEDLSPEPIDPARFRLSANLARLAHGADILVVTLLVLGFLGSVWTQKSSSSALSAERALLGSYALLSAGHALVEHGHLMDRALILSGGNDWLAYEGFARDVLASGPLLTEGKPLGQGLAFYYQPLYVYWLALVHAALGEGLFGPLLGNALLGVGASLLTYLATRELFGRPSAVAALAVITACRYTFFAPTAGLLLSENLLILLVPLLLWLLALAGRSGRKLHCALAGAALGLAGLARTTPLAILPFACLILRWLFRRQGLSLCQNAVRVGLFVAMCFLTISPATARNLVVSGKPVLITSSAGANLWEAHRPSARVDLSRIDRDPLYERLGLDRQTREVFEFIRQDPAGYAATLVPMFLYAVGVVGAVNGTWDLHYGLVAMWAVYLLAVAIVREARGPRALFVHAFVLTHLGFMTVIFSHQYGFRLVLPMYAGMAPIVGALAGGLARLVSSQLPALPRAIAPAALAAGALWVAVAVPLWIARDPWTTERREALYTLNGDAARAALAAAQSRAAEQGLGVYFAGEDSRSDSIAYLRGLAYPRLSWFDGSRGLVAPAEGASALYVLPAPQDRGDAAAVARACLGSALRPVETVLPGPPVEAATVERATIDCLKPAASLGAPFEGTAKIDGYTAPATVEAGRAINLTMVWTVTARPPARARPLARLVDSRGRRWGQAEVNAYPSSSWRAGETVMGSTQIEVDPTAPPGTYGLELGFTAGAGLARLAEDGPWGARGATFARTGTIRLVSRSQPLNPEQLPISIRSTAEMAGVRLLGAAADRESPRPGERVRLSLFWQSASGGRPDLEVVLALRDAAGAVLREWRGRPVDGAYPTPEWKPGELVRDTWDLVIPPLPGAAELAVGLAPPGAPSTQLTRLLALSSEPITRRSTPPAARAPLAASFGDRLGLVGFDPPPRRVRLGATIETRLVWRALVDGTDSYTISVQVIDSEDRVVAQHDAEPSNGRRPTAGWLAGEYVDDGHQLRIPREIPRGRYSLAVVVYRPEDGQRLVTTDGADRLTLPAELVIE